MCETWWQEVSWEADWNARPDEDRKGGGRAAKNNMVECREDGRN